MLIWNVGTWWHQERDAAGDLSRWSVQLALCLLEMLQIKQSWKIRQSLIHQYRSYRHVIKNHCGWVTHICVGNLTIIGSDNDLSPGRRQVIIWTNSGIFLIGHLSKSIHFIQENAFKAIVCRMAAILSRPQYVNTNGIQMWSQWTHDVILESLVCQNVVSASLWRNNDANITSLVCWDCTDQFHHHCKIYKNMLLTSIYNFSRKKLFSKGPMYNYHWYDMISSWPDVTITRRLPRNKCYLDRWKIAYISWKACGHRWIRLQ